MVRVNQDFFKLLRDYFNHCCIELLAMGYDAGLCTAVDVHKEE